MLKIVVNDKAVLANVDKRLRRQIPAAFIKGLNRGAYDTRDHIETAIPFYVDRPTAFTLRGPAVKRATANNRTAYVYIKRLQEKYLKHIVYGGAAYGNKVVPFKTWPLNAYGNLPRNATKSGNTYLVNVRGLSVYFRKGGGGRNTTLTPMAFLTNVRHYRRTFPFFKIGKAIAKQYVIKKIKREVSKLTL